MGVQAHLSETVVQTAASSSGCQEHATAGDGLQNVTCFFHTANGGLLNWKARTGRTPGFATVGTAMNDQIQIEGEESQAGQIDLLSFDSAHIPRIEVGEFRQPLLSHLQGPANAPDVLAEFSEIGNAQNK